MIRLDPSATVLFENTAQHDHRVFMQGMTEQDNQDMWRFCREGKYHNYWGSRMNEYWWALQMVQRFDGSPNVLDLGSGRAMWPDFVKKSLAGTKVQTVDQPPGVENYEPAPGYNIITAISSVEHFSDKAKRATRRLVEALPPRGLLVVTTEICVGGCHEAALSEKDFADTLGVHEADVNQLYKEAHRNQLTNKWTIACVLGVQT